MGNRINNFRDAYIQFTKLFKNMSLIEVHMSEEDMLNFHNYKVKDLEDMGIKEQSEYVPKKDIVLVVAGSEFNPKFKIVHNGK